MSKFFNWVLSGTCMRRVCWALGLVFVLFLAGCGPSQGGGDGVRVSILNHAELQNVYIPFDRPIGGDQLLSGRDGDFVKISELNLLVHNAGYADSLVALYVTGFDPNLFAVLPTGPYVLQGAPHRCYKDIQLSRGGDYSIQALCAASDELTLGGGISRSGTGTRYDAAAYGTQITDWLGGIERRIRGSEESFIERFGNMFGGLGLECSLTNPTEGKASGSCRLSSQLLDFFSQRSSRGSMLLMWYGSDVRNCGNDCTVVPSSRFGANSFLRGDSEYYAGGEALNVDYNIYLNRARWPANLNDHEQLFQVSACYLYTTYATPVVCISPSGRSDGSEVCSPGVQQIGHGQPAPVRITNIAQQNQGSRVMFTIFVENQLNGRVFHPGGVDFCAPGAPSSYRRELIDVAKVIDARVLGELEALDCRDGTIRLDDRGRGQISCFMDIPEQAYNRGAYQTTLNVEIGYLYREQQSVRSVISRI